MCYELEKLPASPPHPRTLPYSGGVRQEVSEITGEKSALKKMKQDGRAESIWGRGVIREGLSEEAVLELRSEGQEAWAVF